jgi:arylsulfatase A-like enzyme
VPLIIVAPDAKGNGHSSPRVVQSIDIYPTLAELCGLPPPAGLEGRSLVPLLNNPAAAWDHPAFTVWSEDGRNITGAAVRTERWRYAEFGPGGGVVEGAMLLDPRNDPQETKNCADDPQLAEVRAQLSKALRGYTAAYKPAAAAP